MIESIIINDGYCKVLDQTLLPLEEKYIKVSNYKDMIEAIKKLRIRGAPAIGIAGLAASALAWDQVKDNEDSTKIFDAMLSEIENARPTAVNLSYAVNIARLCLQDNSLFSHDAILWDKTRFLATQEKEASHKMAERGVEFILGKEEELRILTHCNTGSLATYGEGTALAVIKALAKRTKVKVWVDETRPLLQGARLTMWELLKEGIECYLITDSMAAHTIKEKSIDMIIFGADRITRNGDSANKIGSYNLSILADYFKIPLYIVAPSSTIDYSILDGSMINIEERDSSEIIFLRGEQIAPESAQTYNPAFDIVDNQLIKAIITEVGVFTQPYDFRKS